MQKSKYAFLLAAGKYALSVAVPVVIVYVIVKAGSMQPSSGPGPTMYTFTDLYNRITTNALATKGDHAFTVSGTPGPTHYSIEQIYEAIPTIDATKVASSTNYLGVKGTLLGNMWNGTSGAFTGGSQANGGADDYNNAGSPPSDRYSKSWTACNAGNSYCGTGDSGADAKDESTGLVWSLPCNGSGCSSFSDSSPLTYSWSNGGANNNSRTANQLCSDKAGWYLPTQKELMMAYINGSYGNLEASGVDRNYWSGTTVSIGTTNAWFVGLSSGYTGVVTKTDPFYVRCVRPL